MNQTWERAARTACAVMALSAASAFAQDRTAVEEIERYRQSLADGNPAELWEARGEDLWKTKRGPKNASLEKCDIGLGPGVVKGAYTVLPKYFPDTDRVQDLMGKGVEFRLCRFTLERQKIDPRRVIQDVKIVPSGVAEVGRLQSQEGFAYLKP